MPKIYQAIFGDINGGYGLLNATCNLEVAKRIASYTDVHEQTPDGIKWDNTLRGFAVEDYYLVMRTFVDPSPAVRDGRVFSHCLIIPINELNNINNLQQLLELLPDNFQKNSLIDNIEPLDDFTNYLPSTPRINSLIKILLNNNADVIAWQDYEGYEDAICTVWNNIAPTVRASLRFGLSFNIQESIGLPGIKILSVPSKMIEKWRLSLVPIVALDSKAELVSEAEKTLGGITTDNNLLQFINNNRIKINQLSDYLPIQKIFKTSTEIESSDLNAILTFLNTLSIYTEGNVSNKLTHNIAIALISKIKTGSIKEIIRVRIESLDVLLPQDLYPELATEIKNRTIDLTNQSPKNLKDLIETLLNPKIQIWWRNIITYAIKDSLQKVTKDKAQILIMLLGAEGVGNTNLINSLIPQKCDEKIFEKVVREIGDVINYSGLLNLAFKRKWYNIFAISLTKTTEFQDAILALRSVDSSSSCTTAYKILLKGYPLSKVLEIAEYFDDAFITNLVAESLLLNNKEVLALHSDSLYHQKLFITLIDKGWDFFSHANAKKILFEMLDNLIAGKGYNEELLSKIANNRKCEILEYNRRSEIWYLLTAKIRSKILQNTSTILLENLTSKSTTEIPDDTVLEQFIVETGISEFLYYNRNNIKGVIPIFGKFSLPDSNLSDYINNYNSTINAIESKQIGKLIFKKHYKSSAYAVMKKTNENASWKHALLECYKLLDVINIGLLKLSGFLSSVKISTDEWWQAAEELIIELYDNGRSLTTVWTRAGGKESDLIMNANPNAVWHNALHMLRHKGRKGISINSLLDEINKQYGENEKFQSLYSLKPDNKK